MYGTLVQRVSAVGAFQNWGEFQKAASNTDVTPETSILSLARDTVLGPKMAVSTHVTLSLSKRDYVREVCPPK
jgi:hypothetical protein